MGLVIAYLFKEEPAKVDENRGRSEYNRLRVENEKEEIEALREDVKELGTILREEVRRSQDAIRTHRH
jgi:hypothetical protein